MLLAMLGVALACGCFGPVPRTAGWLDQVRGRGGPLPTDGLYLQTVLIDQPAGDAYLNREIWTAASKPLTHPHAILLAQNGLRVGIVTGPLPGEFDRLLSTEATVINPMLRTVQPGKPKVVPLNGPLERAQYQVIHDLAADPTNIDVMAAECGLAVTATQEGTARLRLHCEFQVQHGDRQAWLKPTADGSSFARQDHKSQESYPTLAFDVTLSPNDYLIVGTSETPAEKLGQACFIHAAEGRVRQRLLVIRAGHGNRPAEPGRPTAAAAAAQPGVVARGNY